MRKRTRGLLSFILGLFLILLGLLFFSLFVSILVLQVPDCAGTITNATPTTSPTSTVAPPVATGTIAPSSAPTPTLTFSDKITACADTGYKALSSLLLFLVNVLALVIVLLLGPFLIWRIWRLSGVPNLVIDPFNNATGNAELDKALAGLNVSTREQLVIVIEDVRQDMIKYGDQGPSEYDSLENGPPPSANVEQSLSNLLTSLKAVPSAGPLQTALQLMSLLFTPRGIKVAITLQKSQKWSSEDIPEIFWISLEVTDLQNRQEPTLFTLWEPKPQHKIDEPDTAKKQEVDVSKTPEDRVRPLLEPAIDWLAVELLRRAMEAQMPRFRPWGIKRYRSQLYNFIGYLYFSGFLAYHDSPHLKVAIDFFKRSIKQDQEWFQPYENLADANVIQVQGIGETPGEADKVLLYQAVSRYHQACSQFGVNKFVMRYLRSLGLSTTQSKQAHTTAMHYLTRLGLMSTTQSKQAHTTAMHYLTRLGLSTTQSKQAHLTAMHYLTLTRLGPSTTQSKHTYAKIVRRLGISTAIAQLLTDDSDLIREAEDLMKIVTQSWELNKEKDGQLLYTFARWSGIYLSMRERDVDKKSLARRYLIYSLIRDDDYWNIAMDDRSFCDVFTEHEFKRLRTIISKKECEVPALSTMEGDQFEGLVNEILEAIS